LLWRTFVMADPNHNRALDTITAQRQNQVLLGKKASSY
jgi:hypothetical protein